MAGRDDWALAVGQSLIGVAAMATLAPPRPSAVVLAVLPLVWLGVITVPYLRTAVVALTHSSFQGAKQAWPTVAMVVAVTAAGLLAGRLSRWRAAELYVHGLLIGAGLLAAGVLFAGRVIEAGGLLVWLVLLSWALGDRILRLVFAGADTPHGWTRAVFAIALGFGTFSHLTLALALLGLLQRWLVVTLLLALSLVFWRDVIHAGRALWRLVGRVRRFKPAGRLPWFSLPLLGLLTSWLVLIIIEVVAPEIQYDALNYHLALPRLYIDQQRFVLTPYLMQSWFSMGVQMNYLLAMLLVDQTAAKLTNFAFLPLTVGAIYTFSRRFFSKPAGLLGATLFMTTPLVAWTASTTYVDLALGCYCFLALSAAYHWLVDRHPGWSVLAGLMAGFALSAKLNAVFLIVPLGIILTAAAIYGYRVTVMRRFWPVLGFGGAALLAGAPWPVLRYIQTGNPVFPFYNNVFRSPLWPPVHESFNFGAFGLGTRPDSFMRLPWELTFNPEKFIEAMPSGILGLGILMLPLLVFNHCHIKRSLFFLPILLVFGLLWAYNAQYMRYLFPVLPLVYMLVGQALASLGYRLDSIVPRKSTSILAALLLVWMLSGSVIFISGFWNIPERIPYRVAFGFESRDQYLLRLLSTYGAYKFIDHKYYDVDAHILAISPDEPRLYSSKRIETANSPLIQPLLQSNDSKSVRILANERGITHVLINHSGLPPHLAQLLIIQPSFLESNAELVYAQKNVEVHRLLNEEEQAARLVQMPPRNLIENSGFEEANQSGPVGWQPYGRPRLDASGVHSREGRGAVGASVESGYVQEVSIVPGKIYTLSHYSRSDVPGSSVRLQINWVDNQGKVVDVSINVFPARSEWKQYTLTATAPPQAAKAIVYANAHTGEVWLDDYLLRARR